MICVSFMMRRMLLGKHGMDAACFKNKYKNMRLENARFYSDRVLTLPLYSDLEKESVEKIVRIVKENLC